MFKKIHSYLLLALAWIFMPKLAFAENSFLNSLKETAEHAGLKPEGSEPIGIAGFSGVVISYLLSFVGAIFFVLMMYGGILWMTSAGSEEKIKKAIQIIRSSLLGIIVIFLSYVLTNFILQKLVQGL